MRSMLLMEWIGGLEEDLLERSEQTAAKRMPRLAPWLATAACLCLVCSLALGVFGGGRKVAMDNGAGEAIPEEHPIYGIGDGLTADKEESLHDSESGGTVGESYGYPCESQSYWALHSMEEMGEWETMAFFSRKELDTWLEARTELDGLDRQKLLQLWAKYDEAYFTKQVLLLSRAGMPDSYKDYHAGSLYVGIGDVETDWLLYLHETHPAEGVDAEGCLYIFSEVDPNCTIEPGDTVETLVVSQRTEPKS